MKNSLWILIVVIPLLSPTIFAQTTNFDFSDDSVVKRLENDVFKLASEEMKGREAGTKGEKIAIKYIKERFKEAGLQPLFDNTYLQHFEFTGEWFYTKNNTLKIADKKYKPDENYFPMIESGNVSVTSKPVYVGYGITDDELEWNDYKNKENINDKIFIIEYYLPCELKEKSSLSVGKTIDMKIETALEHDSKGIIFINTNKSYNAPNIDIRRSAISKGIPIVFAGEEIYKQLKAKNFDIELTLTVEVDRKTYTGSNVVGYINNEAKNTIVIGGHHDHLGYGGSSSRHNGEPAIHYGADDNASGVAGVLETARYLSNQDFDNNNYIFITFSAEEKGLIGSRYFTRSGDYDMNRINYMINFDMIGRMENNNLTIFGTGTSPTWRDLMKTLQPEHLKAKLIDSGKGLSDHTSFYLQGIPVIFFFTGFHEDYHNISDTYDKINYEGQKEVIKLAWKLIEELDQYDKLEFTETQ